MARDNVEIYKDQTLAVESLLNHHSEFDPALDPQFTITESEVFAAVFQPDWSKYNDDYRQAYSHLMTNEPGLMDRAQQVFKKFLEAHGIAPVDLELTIP